jgi:hypothetical protein
VYPPYCGEFDTTGGVGPPGILEVGLAGRWLASTGRMFGSPCFLFSDRFFRPYASAIHMMIDVCVGFVIGKGWCWCRVSENLDSKKDRWTRILPKLTWADSGKVALIGDVQTDLSM